MSDERPIGVFDSGLGGLTVVHAMRQVLPRESIVYLGDTARVPYGTRSPATVVRYARGCAQLLIERGIKALVIACNTASAVASEVLQTELDVPVIGVVGPGARAAVAQATLLEAETGQPVRIGVLCTASTMASGAYPREVRRLSTRHEVAAQPAPLLVPLVEEGWLEGEVPRLAVARYLEALLEHRVSVIVLGCTHYPLLEGVIASEAARLCERPPAIVDSARAAADAVAEVLTQRELLAASANGSLDLMVTDLPASFEMSASRFLGEPVPSAQQVDISPCETLG